MRSSRIQAVDRVRLEAPLGMAEKLRWFYGEVAQLVEVPEDESLEGTVCFSSEGIRLVVFLVEEPEIDLVASRVTIAVPSLSGLIELFEENKVEYDRVSGLSWTDRRVYARDPAGNRINFKKSWQEQAF